MSDSSTSSGLGRAISRLGRQRVGEAAPGARLSTAVFQAAVLERFRSLERQVDEVMGRVNGRIFLAGMVALSWSCDW